MATAPIAPRHRIGRLTIGFGMALALATVLSGALVFTVASAEMSGEVDESLAHDAARLLATTHVPALVARKVEELDRTRGISDKGHVVYDRNGRVLAGLIALAHQAPGYATVDFRDGLRRRHGRALTVRLDDGGALVVIAHSEIGEAAREMLLPSFIGVAFAAALAGIVGSWSFSRMVASRTARIQAAANTIAHGDLSHRIPLDHLDGIFAEQALSLNRMLDRMEEMVRSQRHFAGHLAHELRTPLTRLRALLAENLASPEIDRVRLLERADRECGSAISTFDALLRLSEIEAGRHPGGLAPLDLRAVIEDVAETMEPVIADAGSTLELGELSAAQISADTGLIHQLLVNLLENVVLHTPPGTRARIEMRRDDAGGAAVIVVSDDGPGIASHARERVIEPFERGPTAPDKGHGLGLAIAQAIVRFHGGTLRLGDAKPGLSVELRLPLVCAGAPAAA